MFENLFVYSVRRVAADCWQIDAPESDPYAPPVRAIVVLELPRGPARFDSLAQLRAIATRAAASVRMRRR
jgi:hypothetical protein